MRDEPTRSDSPVSTTRSSFGWSARGTSAIGERAAHVPEELALEDALGKASHVDGDEGPRAPRRRRVEGARDGALAASVLAGDEDVRVGGPDARDHLQHGPHRLRLGQEVGRLPFAEQAVLDLQPLAAAQGARELGLRLQDPEKPLVLPGFLDEVARAAPHRLDGELHAAPRRHHDDGQRRVEGADLREQVQAFAAGGRVPRVVEVDEEDVELSRFEGREDAAGRGDAFDLAGLALQEEAQSLDDVLLVVRDQEPNRNFRHAPEVTRIASRVHSCLSATIGSTASARRAGR